MELRELHIHSIYMIKATYAVLRSISPQLAAALGDSLSKQVIAGYRNDDLSLTSKAVDAILLTIADTDEMKEMLTKLAADEIAKAEAEKKDCR